MCFSSLRMWPSRANRLDTHYVVCKSKPYIHIAIAFFQAFTVRLQWFDVAISWLGTRGVVFPGSYQ